ncbi:MAG: M20/M25/M40 family metallo-hydrolase, partial [Microvirga sp.]
MPHLDQVLADVDKDLDNSLQRLFQWLRIPSISTDPAYAKDCRRAAEWLKGDLEAMGFEASLRDTPGHPVVLAHAPKPGAPHVLFYGHYDVQPVDPVDLWETPPFEPRMATLKDGRKVISARGACDDKGQVMTFIEACRAWKAVAGELPIDITFLIEGAEEDGSKFLPEWVEANKDELKADVVLVCDTGMWDQDTPMITTALRGMVYEEVVVRCADRDLHSGLFGGAARNPIHVLSKIIAALHDDDGRVAIPGFYDGVSDTPTQVLEQWRKLDLRPEDFLGQVGLRIPAGEKGRMLIEQIQSRPTCDANGIIGGYTGVGAKTVIAGEASAKVSFRLVGDQNP